MDSTYSDSRPMFVQPPWNQTQTNDSIMPYPMNNEQSESQPSSKRPRLHDDTVFNPTASSNSSWMAPPSSNTPPVNKGTAKIFYKTRMCAKFKAGTCMNGDPCNFAHGMEDLRQPPSNWQEIVGPPPPPLVGDRGRERERERPSSSVPANNWEDDQKIILRMKLCRKFCFGEECPYGDRCNFIHEDLSKFREESGKLRESLAISVGTTDSASVENSSHQVEVNRRPAPLNNGGSVVKTVYWKTRICLKFENGQCPFGDNCHFAHGQAELLRHSVGNGDAVNAVASLSKQTVVSGNEAFAMKSAAQVVRADSSGLNDEGRREKCLLKWSDSKKINRIYGDWIDDLPVGQKSTKPVES
ncbi:Zinc finger CCCH domain-containing protein 39 [Hirschfeldia incana]|nr:Zinc finger CCCH domain-containing protein 39 [Hirschfeldia incana]KAJ0238323.1 Zinc finger CCCH domain-containing protein 39 [Hirschfeldia incana]